MAAYEASQVEPEHQPRKNNPEIRACLKMSFANETEQPPGLFAGAASLAPPTLLTLSKSIGGFATSLARWCGEWA